MTRANVIQLGCLILFLGGFGYGAFKLLGFNDVNAGIAAETLLVILVLGWTASYLLRVVTGNMTFMEQRKRYRQEYEAITDAELQRSFDAMPENEKLKLLEEIESENKST